jgi:diguanylate cyclase (GGDEF)-like protein
MKNHLGELSRFSRHIWLMLGMLLLFAMLFSAYVYTEKQLDRSYQIRQSSLLLADELRQSSDDLTRMARTYVVTGDGLYLRHYQEILAIRDGRTARPVRYDDVYWDLVPSDDRRPRGTGPAIALLDLMRRDGFSAPEFARLAQAKENSDALVVTEMAAMAMLDPGRRGAITVAAQAEARVVAVEMLHDGAYHLAKAGIMRPIGEFRGLADRRTQADVLAAEDNALRMRIVFALFGLLLAAMLWRTKRKLYSILGASIDQLHGLIARLGSGDGSTAIHVADGMQDSVLGRLSETQVKLARSHAERDAAQAKNQRITQLYAALSQCNQAIVRCTSETELFAQICRAIVVHGGMKMAWIGLLGEDGLQVRPVASFGSGVDYLDGIDISLEPGLASGSGPIGIAYRQGAPFWCQDFLHDPAAAHFRARGARFGLAASAALPLHRDGAIIGFLNPYAGVSHAFDEGVRQLLVEMVVDIDFALKNFALAAQRKEANERIQYLAHFDALTGLPNRLQLRDRVHYALSLAQRSGKSVALMFLDLDHFKNINDSLGHSVGDALLVELAARLRAVLRAEDTVSRMGGDEFSFLLYGVDAQSAASAAQQLQDVMATPFQIGEHNLSVTASIGIALYPGDGEDMETLFKNADAAMYRVKREGRHGYRFFTAEMQLRSVRNLQLVNALRRALELEQFEVHYQPQVSLQGGGVCGAEALLRWTDAELGVVTPAEFIPVAEDSGLILQIGEWVLRQAARQAKAWMVGGLPPLVIAVNLSAVQFRHPDLPSLVTRILDEEGLPPEYLELELTEGVAVHDPQGAIATMNNLHQRGVRMSIDDFGTGYSSLSHLKKFKVYKLKIDQSFVRDICTDPEDRAIVGAIIHMAKSLGLQTIAEGVETVGQLAYLREQGCDEMQGYYYSRPLAPAQFEALVRKAEPLSS